MAAILIFYEMAAILKKSRWPHFDFKLNGFWEVHAQFRNVSIDFFSEMVAILDFSEMAAILKKSKMVAIYFSNNIFLILKEKGKPYAHFRKW